MKVLIIEDELKTGRELKTIAEGIDPAIEVLEILPSVEMALDWFKENAPPDLIFSDIQLADGLSFSIFESVDVRAPIIFCTAYDDYALRAFDANGIDYLLKPVDELKLRQSLDKYSRLQSLLSGPGGDYQKKLESMLLQMKQKHKNTLLVHFREKIIPLKTADIAFIHYANGIISVYMKAGQEHYLTHSLDELEGMLDPVQFFRANRQFIINRESVKSIEHYFSRRLIVWLHSKTPENIVISKSRSSEFLQWITM
ncbi:LytR/AlgR family response regulator transcription factor [Arcticibacter tournemirensis]